MAEVAGGQRSVNLEKVAVYESKDGGLMLGCTDPDAPFTLYVGKGTAAYKVLHDLLVRNGRKVD